ncbi:MAG: hypothetical protein M1813_004828 [Trichoglossum hirsutum]|nr:MAG: hypothetical protein M1813_004828 [Trichoglossum hirsutum]
MVQLQASPRKNFCNILFLRNTQFFSRSSQLDKLEQLLFLEERKPKIAITGLGGIGKIQIALELAYRTREKYRERSIFWILAIALRAFIRHIWKLLNSYRYPA